MTDATGLRERKKQRTRDDIRAAAARLFDERGFDDVTVDEISEACDISPRTFYRYFASKEDVVLGPVESSIERLRDLLTNRPLDEAPTASLRAAFTHLALDIERDPEAVLRHGALIRATPSLQLRRLQRQAALEAGITPTLARRFGAGAGDMRPALLVACAFSAFRIAMITWMQDGGTGSLADRVDEALGQLAAGFS
jgi:AcrR family transcriptional regulator